MKQNATSNYYGRESIAVLYILLPLVACRCMCMMGDLPEATALLIDLRENYHVFCSVVILPVISKGHIIYRLIPTAAHTDADIEQTLKAFSETRAKLEQGEYKVDAVPDMADVK